MEGSEGQARHDREVTTESDIASVLEVLGSRREDLRVAQELIEVLPVPVYFKGRDGHYLGVNRAWEEFFGVARADIVGHKVRDLYPGAPAVAERHESMDEQLWANPGRPELRDPDRHARRARAPHDLLQGDLRALRGRGRGTHRHDRRYHRAQAIGAARGHRERGGALSRQHRVAGRRDPRDHAGDVRAPRLGLRRALVARRIRQPPALRRDLERRRPEGARVPRREQPRDLRSGNERPHPPRAHHGQLGLGRRRHRAPRLPARAARQVRGASRRVRPSRARGRARAGRDRVLQPRGTPSRPVAACRSP